MSVDGAFSLRDVIRDVVENSGLTDTHLLAKEVDRCLTGDDRDLALAECLPKMVQHFLVKYRMHTAIVASVGEGQQRSAKQSWKGRAIREYWKRALEELYNVDGGNKRLGDCTHDDLTYLIRERERQARFNAARALELRGLQDLVVRNGVGRVRDLPEIVLSEVLVYRRAA